MPPSWTAKAARPPTIAATLYVNAVVVAARHWQTFANALQVRKLYKMLENPQDESVVRWGNEGDSFVVLENEKFTKHILPVTKSLELV